MKCKRIRKKKTNYAQHQLDVTPTTIARFFYCPRDDAIFLIYNIKVHATFGCPCRNKKDSGRNGNKVLRSMTVHGHT